MDGGFNHDKSNLIFNMYAFYINDLASHCVAYVSVHQAMGHGSDH